MRALFTLSVLLASFLLFLVQPLAGKLVLPSFGGAPAVWASTLLFFQTALLLGYGYAHLLGKLPPARAALVHGPLLALAGLLCLPFGTDNPVFRWVTDRLASAPSANPAPLVLVGLGALVGLPFVVLSSSAPLLQRLFARTDDPAAADPYFLYAASNVGSLAALFAYPFVVEPRFRLGEQATGWAAGYALVVPLALLCVWIASRHRAAAPAPDAATEETTADRPVDLRRRLLWIALGAVPTSLLSGVTTFVTTNIAPVPLLWIVPLALYLLTFILAFRRKPFLSPESLSRIAPLFLTPLAVVMVLEETSPPVALLHLATFFLAAWMCHARLYADRPRPERLTEFYFWMSFGGMVGGAFNGLIAPSVFNTIAEYPIALVLAAGLKLPYRRGERPRLFDPLLAGVLLGATLAVSLAVGDRIAPGLPRSLMIFGAPAVLAFLASDRPVRYALCLGAVFLASGLSGVQVKGTLLARRRSFFGESMVTADKTPDGRVFHRLVHGNTLHGTQDLSNPDRPLTYYHPTGPIGQVIEGLKPQLKNDRLGLVGLGVGSLAAYGRPGQRLTFFEIDPLVEKIASDPRLFTFLSRAKAPTDVVLGDARLTLARQPDGAFGLLAIDAFSSDAIPVHLLTREAFALYMRKLRPGGVLAVHVSNRYLDLIPVVARNGKDLGLAVRDCLDGPTEDEKVQGKTASNWIILARKKSDFGPLAKDIDWNDTEITPGVRAWTDDYSNVLSVFKQEE